VVVFAVLWVGFAVGLVSGGQAFADAWGWLNGLEPVARIAAWILFLPIAVGLWAWNTDLPAPVFAAVCAGPAAWTLVAVGALSAPSGDPERRCAADEARDATRSCGDSRQNGRRES
jgi:hypothetical protein